ncbi:MAG: SgcJ/EcaC family oxidoreductase [Alphaproteobacteria bacterium]|nr:SgcJ/EcaC family oxidoreductase [Alphaproteobacteria bacterium]
MENGDVNAIKDVAMAWGRAYASGDLEALRRFYSEESVVIPRRDRKYSGWSEIRQFFERRFRAAKVRAQSKLENIQVHGDWAFMQGMTTITAEPKDGGKPEVENARYFILFKRYVDGWKVYQDMDTPAQA